MGTRSIFSRGGQIKDLGTKIPQQGPGMEPLWESRQVVKIMQNNSSTERFSGTTNAQKHFATFPGGGKTSALSCPFLRAPMSIPRNRQTRS